MKRSIAIAPRSRRGIMMPAIAVGMLVVMVATALVLNKLWISAAQVELATSAEASALAAARAMISDDMLLTDPPDRKPAARKAARDVAINNRVAGRPPRIPKGGIWFGRRVRDGDGNWRFFEEQDAPTSVAVTVFRHRSRRNPVATMYEGASGAGGSDLWARAEASIDNRIRGFQPVGATPIPLLPLAILESHVDQSRTDTWDVAINKAGGDDRYSWDETKKAVVARRDGIPELRLISAKPNTNAQDDESNCRLLDIGSGYRIRRLTRQCREGIRPRDLEELGGSFKIEDNDTQEVRGRGEIRNRLTREFSNLIGKQKIVPIYQKEEGGWVRCRDFVAIRILSVRAIGPDQCEIICQPTCLCTRTAILIDPDHQSPRRNRYVHKIQITH